MYTQVALEQAGTGMVPTRFGIGHTYMQNYHNVRLTSLCCSVSVLSWTSTSLLASRGSTLAGRRGGYQRLPPHTSTTDLDGANMMIYIDVVLYSG